MTAQTWIDGELADLRQAQEVHMLDRCVILAYHASRDSYGLPKPAYVAGDETPCGLDEGNRTEQQSIGHVPLTDAVLRLPLTATITARSRVRITRRHGAFVNNPQPVYEVAGVPRLGASGLLVNLRLVTE